MAKRVVKFEPSFFDSILKSEKVAALGKDAAQDVLNEARASAPVDTGDYREGLTLSQGYSGQRRVWRVTGTDWKTLLVESTTGNLQRSLRRVKAKRR